MLSQIARSGSSVTVLQLLDAVLPQHALNKCRVNDQAFAKFVDKLGKEVSRLIQVYWSLDASKSCNALVLKDRSRKKGLERDLLKAGCLHTSLKLKKGIE